MPEPGFLDRLNGWLRSFRPRVKPGRCLGCRRKSFTAYCDKCLGDPLTVLDRDAWRRWKRQQDREASQLHQGNRKDWP